jgi:ABC-type nitrate/sulfonate/bicarbonate transport system substrate-binding protein
MNVMNNNPKDKDTKETNNPPKQIIPDSELWLYENPEALASFEKGLKEAAEGKFSEINLDEL